MRLYEYIQQGGPIMYLLLVINIVGWAIMLSKFYFLTVEMKMAEKTSSELSEDLNKMKSELDTASLIELTKQQLASYIVKAEKGLNTVKIIASISPLLGLLGTVIGVLTAFHVMSETGLSNPSSFAKGISMALITTVGGMIVAIPHFVGHNYLLGLLDKLETALEKKIMEKVL
ncbi:MotA/TolQ/ExbB proton channel family protein [Bacteriovorax sp. DB6_IX]|uniref:MotA/TolQ/ExbB proton channel family protein n=1 Tax=Bacteriovorax sp. DB6_IX TaxID=1353530 RepID=UPI00038A091C|nr:MotA/TolQ/ExbB proton channel family protein [Bacteriovorax sp. DB6_IX]EQC50818.1 transporter, MotA/TolQ/ExbB proton channel family protein [Bacteriovorax sp. DB6_IX]